jgi:hypothetical protein
MDLSLRDIINGVNCKGLKLKVGDEVWSNHGPSVVKNIELVEMGQKEGGIKVKEIWWSMVPNHVVVDMENGHWAYGTQLTPYGEDSGNQGC